MRAMLMVACGLGWVGSCGGCGRGGPADEKGADEKGMVGQVMKDYEKAVEADDRAAFGRAVGLEDAAFVDDLWAVERWARQYVQGLGLEAELPSWATSRAGAPQPDGGEGQGPEIAIRGDVASMKGGRWDGWSAVKRAGRWRLVPWPAEASREVREATRAQWGADAREIRNQKDQSDGALPRIKLVPEPYMIGREVPPWQEQPERACEARVRAWCLERTGVLEGATRPASAPGKGADPCGW